MCTKISFYFFDGSCSSHCSCCSCFSLIPCFKCVRVFCATSGTPLGPRSAAAAEHENLNTPYTVGHVTRTASHARHARHGHKHGTRRPSLSIAFSLRLLFDFAKSAAGVRSPPTLVQATKFSLSSFGVRVLLVPSQFLKQSLDIF